MSQVVWSSQMQLWLLWKFDRATNWFTTSDGSSALARVAGSKVVLDYFLHPDSIILDAKHEYTSWCPRNKEEMTAQPERKNTEVLRCTLCSKKFEPIPIRHFPKVSQQNPHSTVILREYFENISLKSCNIAKIFIKLMERFLKYCRNLAESVQNIINKMLLQY